MCVQVASSSCAMQVTGADEESVASGKVRVCRKRVRSEALCWSGRAQESALVRGYAD